MNIARIMFPDKLTYDRQHNWARVEGDVIEGTRMAGRGGLLGGF